MLSTGRKRQIVLLPIWKIVPSNPSPLVVLESISSALTWFQDYIKIVLKAVLKYDTEPDRRKMIDDEMIHYMESICSQFKPDSWKASFIEWTYLCHFVGYRSIECCQNKQISPLTALRFSTHLPRILNYFPHIQRGGTISSSRHCHSTHVLA